MYQTFGWYTFADIQYRHVNHAIFSEVRHEHNHGRFPTDKQINKHTDGVSTDPIQLTGNLIIADQDLLYNLWGPVQNEYQGPLCSKIVNTFKMETTVYWSCMGHYRARGPVWLHRSHSQWVWVSVVLVLTRWEEENMKVTWVKFPINCSNYVIKLTWSHYYKF